ncbi:MAG: response regulator [Calditrichaceae bacterium]|nr:response regulator [Calditrichaceae bacterium]MBN2707593.1 response regulator [Calditrichaceae bacterium]
MNAKSIKLLVVDDSLIMRRAILKYLEDYNFNVVGTATNGHSALELFAEHKPDIVTLDLTMPGLNGLTVLEQMLEIYKHSKIIIITALKDKMTGLEALQLGARGYVTKPFNEEKLKETFKVIIEELMQERSV